MGLTTTLYYLSIQYIPISLGIILLMQSIWISLVIEVLVTKKKPSFYKIISVIIALTGTFLATNIFNQDVAVDFRGLLLGFGAGISYSIAIFASSSIESQVSSSVRSQYLVLGGLVLIGLISLAMCLLVGFLSGVQYVVPDFIKTIFPFTVLRPLHTLFALSWIFMSSIGGIFWYINNEKAPKNVMKWQFWIFTITGVLIAICYVLKKIEGKEYIEFPNIFYVPILLG